MEKTGGVMYVIKDKHTGLYLRLIDGEETGADFEIELTDNINFATTVSGWGYALNAAMALQIPFELVRL